MKADSWSAGRNPYERAAAAEAKKAARAKAEKEFLKAIHKSGLSLDDVKGKLGV